MGTKKVESLSEDAISSLPDEILAQILSFLPTKRAASTTLLSTRWRTLFALMNHLFASQHHLDFDQSDFLNTQRPSRREEIVESFRVFVVKTLSCSNKKKPINKFSLNYREDLHHMARTNGWICNALERGVSELDLCIKTTWICLPPRSLPSGFFTNETLVKLTLGTELCVGLDCPKIYLPLLKTLFLDTVFVTREVFVSCMLEGCPLLEEFSLNYVAINHIRAPPEPDFISHKTLKRLTIRTNMQQIDFDTPPISWMFRSANFLDSLVEAHLDIALVQGMRIGRRNDNLSNVIYSLLNYWEEAWYHTYPWFENLVRLSFETKTTQGWKVLTCLIENAPKLETLVIKGLHCISDCGVCINENIVKVLEIYGYRGSDQELRQLERFLCQMDSLQVIKLELDAAIDDDHKKLQLTNDILNLPKRRSKCHIHFL